MRVTRESLINHLSHVFVIGLIAVFPASSTCQIATTAFYRLYSSKHFYTTNCDEKSRAILSLGFKLEGVSGFFATAHAPDTVPLFRMLNSAGDHFYTTSVPETNSAKAIGYHTEGIAGYVATTQIAGTIPLHRLALGVGPTQHFYTVSQEEVKGIVPLGWKDEGVAGYVWTTGANPCPKFPVVVDRMDNINSRTMITRVTITADGHLNATTSIRNPVALNGFCGSMQIYLYDSNKQFIKRYGMANDQQWCVDGDKVPWGHSSRTDATRNNLAPDVLTNFASVAVVQKEGPGKPPNVAVIKQVAQIAVQIISALGGGDSGSGGSDQ